MSVFNRKPKTEVEVIVDGVGVPRSITVTRGDYASIYALASHERDTEQRRVGALEALRRARRFIVLDHPNGLTSTATVISDLEDLIDRTEVGDER